MKKEKDQPNAAAEKEQVKTPTPPQDMDPSKTPRPGKKVLGDEEKVHSDEEDKKHKKH